MRRRASSTRAGWAWTSPRPWTRVSPWLSSDRVALRGRLADLRRASTNLRDSAILALLVAFFAITLYIRARFHEYKFALGALLAVIHDVCVVTGIVAIFAHFGIVDAEINLTLVAALLTIVGYSLNDTIVVYDRIRENTPRMDGTMQEVVDQSINDTLSRTLLTSITTLFPLVVLFALNYGRRSAIEGFSFAILCGVLIGTYSTIFIASPFVLWAKRRRGDRPRGNGSEEDRAARRGELIDALRAARAEAASRNGAGSTRPVSI